jgi:N-acetylglucosaminyldiphosphoundecaprenol N-acetyl-beta-D-mannosaminyltransferase
VDEGRGCTIFGIEFYAGRFDDAAAMVLERALAGWGGYATLTSVHGVVEAQHNPALLEALGEAWRNFPDGVPVTWAEHHIAGVRSERVCGIDLLPAVVERGQALGVRHYLYGSSPAVLEPLRARLEALAPESRIVGAAAPPFGPVHQVDASEELERIRQVRPHIVWVGLGAPKQELWMHRNADRLKPALVVGVGAAFDIVSGAQPRAPLWMQHHGLEWLYRLSREPRRLIGRYGRANSEFLARFAIQVASERIGGGRSGP